MKFEIKFSEDKNELSQALNLAKETFVTNKDKKLNSQFKDLMWLEHPSFGPNTVLIAKTGDKVVSILRIVPSKFNLKNSKSFLSASLTSICTHQDYQGKGLSTALITYALQYCKSAGFDSCHVIASRSVDYYYPKFGFQGLSSYTKAIIKGKNLVLNNDLKIIKKIDLKNIKKYQSLHIRSYKTTNSLALRSIGHWNLLLKRSLREGFDFHEIRLKNKIVGYLIYKNNTIFELATEETVKLDWLASLFLKNLPELTLMIPSDHKILKMSSSFDVAITKRSCPFGGHLIKWLNKPKLKLNSNCLINEEFNLNYFDQY